MTTPILTDEVTATLEELLTMEETLQPTQRLADLEARRARRQSIQTIIQTIEGIAARQRQRLSRLPKLPDRGLIEWARAVLRFPNLAFLEVDTDGLSEDADILRIVLLDPEGTPLYAQTVKPRRPLSDKIRHLTAIDPYEIACAPELAQVWDELLQVLSGRYVLSFNLPFDMGKLTENAARSHLPPVTIIGACLMEQAGRYFQQQSYPSLSALCVRIGHPLPDHPAQTAWDRARGQMALLEAMSEGITDAAAPEPEPQDDPDDADPLDDDLDSHPF